MLLGSLTASGPQACTADASRPEPSSASGRLPAMFGSRTRHHLGRGIDRGGRSEAVGKGIRDRVANYVLVILPEKALQAIGIHDVLSGHVGDCFRRNRRNSPPPEVTQNDPHTPLAGSTDQPGSCHLNATGEGEGLSAAGDVENGE